MGKINITRATANQGEYVKYICKQRNSEQENIHCSHKICGSIDIKWCPYFGDTLKSYSYDAVMQRGLTNKDLQWLCFWLTPKVPFFLSVKSSIDHRQHFHSNRWTKWYYCRGVRYVQRRRLEKSYVQYLVIKEIARIEIAVMYLAMEPLCQWYLLHDDSCFI